MAKERSLKSINRIKKQNLQNQQSNYSNPYAELSSKELICYLGSSPVYIHSVEDKYKRGLRTASVALRAILEDVVTKVKAKAESSIVTINNQWAKILATTNKRSVKEFSDWWKNNIENYKVRADIENGDNNAFLIMALLEQLKQGSTTVKAYEFLTDERSKSEVKAGDYSTLVDSGFISAEFKLDKNQHLKPGTMDAITGIRKNFRENRDLLANELTKLIKNVESNHTLSADYIEQIKTTIQNSGLNAAIVQEPNIRALAYLNKKQQLGLGNLYEILSPLIATGFINGQQITAKNVAGEKNSKNTTNYKIDTEFQIGELILTASDKTGMSAKFGSKFTNIENYTQKMFTSQFNPGTGTVEHPLSIGGIGTFINLPQEQIVEFENLANYVVVNSKLMYRRNLDEKKLIINIFAWLKICNDIIGAGETINEIPMAIRNMGTFYNTADLLQAIVKCKPNDITQFISKTKLENFYSTAFNFSTPDPKDIMAQKDEKGKQRKLARENLYSIKLDHLRGANGRKKAGNYRELKDAIKPELEKFYKTISMKGLTFDSYYWIKLDSIIKQ